VFSAIQPLENIEVDSVANLHVLVDVDESFATEVEVAQQAPGPVAGLGMEPLGAEARDPGVAGARRWGLPQGDVAGTGEHQAYVAGDGQVAKSFESHGEPRLGL